MLRGEVEDSRWKHSASEEKPTDHFRGFMKFLRDSTDRCLFLLAKVPRAEIDKTVLKATYKAI